MSDYISESINIASRLNKITPGLRFVAHSDTYLGPEAKVRQYIMKRISLRGVDKPLVVYIDRDDYTAIPDKSMFADIT